MIDEKERAKRRAAYELAKQNSNRGVELTPETEKLMAQYVNGEIGEQAFFAEIWRLLGVSPPLH